MNTQQALLHARSLDIEPIDAQTLLLQVIQRSLHDRAWLLLNDTFELSIDQQAQFQQGLARLLDNEPLAYVTGWQAFHGLELQVTTDVLVPRADTETLVNWALAIGSPQARVLDMGTGSGAIALALKHQRPDWSVHAVDQSAQALEVAQANARRLQLDVLMKQSDWFSQVQGRFDLIVSNPPYIAQGDPHLVAVGEIGLDGFVPGLDMARQQHFYRTQLALAQRHGLPVLLHVRRSADALLSGLRLCPVVGGLAHAFNGSRQQADQFTAMGFKLGFGGALTFERALQLRRLASEMPLNALVLETDAPDIPPRWLYRTQAERTQGAVMGRNEPAELVRIAQCLAELRGMPLADLAQASTANAMQALPKLGPLWARSTQIQAPA